MKDSNLVIFTAFCTFALSIALFCAIMSSIDTYSKSCIVESYTSGQIFTTKNPARFRKFLAQNVDLEDVYVIRTNVSSIETDYTFTPESITLTVGGHKSGINFTIVFTKNYVNKYAGNEWRVTYEAKPVGRKPSGFRPLAHNILNDVILNIRKNWSNNMVTNNEYLKVCQERDNLLAEVAALKEELKNANEYWPESEDDTE